MMRNRYRAAAWFAYLTGVLHLAAPLASGLERSAVALALMGGIWIVLGLGLARLGSRLVAWLTWFVALGGLVLAAGGLADPEGVNPLLYQWILGANIGVLLCLFFALWRGRTAA